MLTGISMTGEGGRWPVDEKKMALGELIGWLDDNDVPYGIDDAGELTVKDDLLGDFRDWFGTCKYTGLPDELICVEGDLWLELTSIVSLGGLASVGGYLDLNGTPITSLGNLTSVGESLNLEETPIASLGNLTSVGGSLDLAKTPIASLGNLASVGGILFLWGALLASLNNLPQVGEDLFLDQSQIQLLTREALQKVKGEIQYQNQATEKWIALSPAELEAIVAENERRESLHSVRESDVDWDLYGR